MAKNTKRTERMNKSDHNVNRAMLLLTAGIVAEFYLLMVNNYYVKGSVNQMLTMVTVLTVMSYVGCTLYFGADGAPVYGELAQDGKIIAAVEFTNFIFGDILSPDA